MKRAVFAVLACATLGGCESIGLTRLDSSGIPVTSENAFQAVDLPVLLNPTGFEARATGIQACLDAVDPGASVCDLVSTRRKVKLKNPLGTGLERPVNTNRNDDVERLRLETALDAFYNDPQTKIEDIKLRRTRVQQRLVSAADMNCGIFTQRLNQVQSSLNFGFGGLATALGGAGAIVTQVDRARFLSGASSIMSGLRAEMNEDFFRRQWIEAVVKAVETERSELRAAMKSHVTDEIGVYPVEEAIAEAIRYNDACSLVSGLRKVNEAVVIADDPAGLRAFRAAYEKAGFDAEFKATVSSSDPVTRSNRLNGVSPATASLALREIAAATAQVRVYAADSTAALDKLKINDAERSGATTKIGAASGTLSEDSKATPSLARYKQQLVAYQATYAELVTDLGAATDDLSRNEKMEFIRANDAASDMIRRAALTFIDLTKGKIASVLEEAQAQSKKNEASVGSAGSAPPTK